MSDIQPNMAGLSRKIASFAIPGITEPRPENHLLIKSLAGAPPPETTDDHRRQLSRMRADAHKRENELLYVQIESLGFNLYTTEEIDSMAVIIVSKNDKEGAGTVRDLHLGPHNESQECETCSGDFRSCFGHYGRINLPKLMHPLGINHIIQILGCVCNSCGGLLVTENDINAAGINRMTGLKRVQAIKTLTPRLSKGCNRYPNTPGTVPCQCGIPIYGTYKDMSNAKDYKLSYKFSKDGRKLFRSPNEIYKILDAISEEDAALLGFTESSHPRSLIMERMLVIPYCARPDLHQDDQVLPDDTTSMYMEITKASNDFFDPGKPASEKEDIIKNLYFKVRHFMKNEGDQYKQGNVKVYTDITTRLQGKTALIRSHIMGKRVNFAGRTVAAPGGYLRVDELGIPEQMAAKLSRPIIVNMLNRSELQSRYESNKVLYIESRSGKFAGNRTMITEQYIKETPNHQLNLGDIIERILEDGDVVIFNRQPSLHRQSLIALKTKIIKGRALMVNQSITSPMNLDFDGDEGNFHVPQTIEAYAEAEQLLGVAASIMNEQNNSPMIATVYNALTGAYILTNDENTPETQAEYIRNLERFNDISQRFIEYQATIPVPVEIIDPERVTEYVSTHTDSDQYARYEVALLALKVSEKKIGLLEPMVFDQCLTWLADRPQYDTLEERVRSEGLIWSTGKALASAAFPEDFYYNAKNVVIRNGVLVSGFLSKATIGLKDGGIITEMYKQLDASAVVDFLSDIQIVTREYIQHFRQFSTGWDDCISDNPLFEQELNDIINQVETKVIALSAGTTGNRIQEEARERQIVNALDVVKTIGDTTAVKYLPPTNNLLIMANAGSKGTSLNLAQMSSLLGQMKVNGRRIQATMPGKRTLPIFRPGDQTPGSRGFCRNSFYSGLMPDELFFHAMGGREGITDTAINTSNTGQLGHNLIKAAEDVHISGDGSVRSADGSIVQFVYGGEGFSAGELGAVKIRGVSIPFFRNLTQVADKISAKYGA